jgi:hypothetical protein
VAGAGLGLNATYIEICNLYSQLNEPPIHFSASDEAGSSPIDWSLLSAATSTETGRLAPMKNVLRLEKGPV